MIYPSHDQTNCDLIWYLESKVQVVQFCLIYFVKDYKLNNTGNMN
jgi:hypothetical protein